MHYYKFHISDYKSHTEHLDLLEDLAYRRMLDWCYLHESPLPKDKKDIARLIRMRTHCDCIANVLREFFDKDKNGDYINKRVFLEINSTNEKSSKARDAANSRWAKASLDANALQPQSERNATQDPLPKTQDPLPKKKGFAPPSQKEVEQYCTEKNYLIDAESFICFYESKGWMIGKNKMKSWKAAVTTWSKRNGSSGQRQDTGFDNRSRAQKVSAKLDEIARKDIEQNGHPSDLGSGSV